MNEEEATVPKEKETLANGGSHKGEEMGEMKLDVEDYLSEIGLGRFPLLLYVLCSCTEMLAACQWMVNSFIHYVPPHQCNLPLPSENDTGNYTIPWEKQKPDSEWTLSQCSVLTPSNKTEKCINGYKYDLEHGPTAASEFGLVCDNAELNARVQSVFFLGVLFGCLILPTITDQFGRRRMAIIYMLLEVPFSVASAFITSWQALAATKFFVAFFIAGATNGMYTLVCEFFPKQHRSLAGNGFWFFWAAGYMSIPFLAYFINNWRYLQVAITTPFIPLALLIIWLVPESPRFLMQQGRVTEVENILEDAARWNGKEMKVTLLSTNTKIDDMETGESDSDTSSDTSSKKYTLVDVIKTKHFNWLAFLLLLVWPIDSLVYYGLSLSTSTLAGDRYVNFFFSGVVEIPAYLVSIILIKYYGRKYPLVGFHIIAGISLLGLMLVPMHNSSDLSWLHTSLAMFGKFGITAAAGAIYLFTSELYPTVVRNAGLGFSSTMARVGGMMAPHTIFFTQNSPEVLTTVFGSLSLVAGAIIILMPETSGRPLPDTLEQVAVPWLEICTTNRKRPNRRDYNPATVVDTQSSV